MNITKKLLLASVMALASAPAGVYANDIKDPHALESIQQAQQWLDKIGPIKGHFSQLDSEGKANHGKFYLARPGHLRFDYETPPLKVVANDGKLAYVDPTIDQVTVMDLNKTALSALLSTDDQWKNKIEIRKVSETNDEKRIEVSQKENPETGVLTLIFSKAPFALKAWEITDFEGKETKVRLEKISPMSHFNKSLFKMPQ